MFSLVVEILVRIIVKINLKMMNVLKVFVLNTFFSE